MMMLIMVMKLNKWRGQSKWARVGEGKVHWRFFAGFDLTPSSDSLDYSPCSTPFYLSFHLFSFTRSTMKTHPGSVVHLSDNPLDSNKVSICFTCMMLFIKTMLLWKFFATRQSLSDSETWKLGNAEMEMSPKAAKILLNLSEMMNVTKSELSTCPPLSFQHYHEVFHSTRRIISTYFKARKWLSDMHITKTPLSFSLLSST